MHGLMKNWLEMGIENKQCKRSEDGKKITADSALFFALYFTSITKLTDKTNTPEKLRSISFNGVNFKCKASSNDDLDTRSM